MIELLFLACLNASPGICEERSLLFTDITPMTCLMGAQPELARWSESHARWHVAKWSCRPLRPDRRDA
ncbi:hypothetical protein [Mangrovicoccus algicola]|uniref:Uncharacterized protein n=1 Tax=Mangrovicoccus algicola TaxID=2771008 RepID=A0A8J7CGD6_9RHOB|nr:hypothetical protein [Mangrovicoccus algicola]MBE3637005.1 hypothetical protein [Mangrovicoccus algicola]